MSNEAENKDETTKRTVQQKIRITTDETGTWWEIVNWVLQDIAEALGELGSRRLEKRENQTRVVTLQRQWFDDPMEIIRETINDIVEATPAPEGWDEAHLPVAIQEERQKQIRAFRQEYQRIRPIPEKALLVESDLPKLMKDALGDQNQFSLGSILKKLHFVYPMPCDKKKLEDGADGSTEE
jgi:hypothetical protein